MWVFEEIIQGRKLTEIINTDHENPKYLPGIPLPSNVVAIPDLTQAACDAHVLVFVLPHQFLGKVCETLKGKLTPQCIGISLIKGMEVKQAKPVLMSQFIQESLGINVSVLMGANIATEVAQQQFCESTLGCANDQDAALFIPLFNSHYFRVNCVKDVHGVELCGALKNVVALGAGFCDGLGMGSNTKAAVMRRGLMEMKKLTALMVGKVHDATYLESCGVADLITTCYGGRNHKCAVAFAKTKESFESLEASLLGGQKLQGTLTAKDVYEVISKLNCQEDFPLFVTVYRTVFENYPVEKFIDSI